MSQAVAREADWTAVLDRGVPPGEAIPSEALSRIAARVVADPAMFQYAPIGGFTGALDLRRALGSFHGVDPNGIFVGVGSLQVLDLLAAELLSSPGRTVLVESPTYDRAMAIFQRHGAQVLGVPVEGDGLDLDGLERRLRELEPAFLYAIPDFQNPSGVTLSASRRRELLELAARRGLTIVEDIPYRDLRYRGQAPPRLGPRAEPRVITLGSLSKTLSPGLRVGYALTDAQTAAALARRAENTYLSPPPMGQAIAAAALEAGLLPSSIDRARQLFAPRCAAAVAAARQCFGDDLLAAPEGGYFIGLRLSGRFADRALLEAARARGLRLTSGGAFLPPAERTAQATFLRLPFQALKPEAFAYAVGVLRTVIQSLEA